MAAILPASVSGAAAEQGNIAIYESYGTYTLDAPPPEMHPIVLQVPDGFRYGESKGRLRDWGLNILTYYPSFTSQEDPTNARFGLDCAGLCNGRILLAIRNRAHSISPSGSPNMGDYIARSVMKWELTPPYPPNVRVRALARSDGFDEGFERLTMPVDRAPPGHPRIEHIYFRRAADTAHYDMAATCNVEEERTTCILHFSLQCNPAIYVSVNGLDISYLKKSQDIEKRADRFVSAMVKDPRCTR